MTENATNKLRAKIKAKCEELAIETRHTSGGHFYYAPLEGETYKSVSALQYLIKDQGIENFQINEAFRYVRTNFATITDGNMDEVFFAAKEAGIVVRDKAGNFGTQIHDFREMYFAQWIERGVKPSITLEELCRKDPMSPPEVISGCAGIDKFLAETGYIPIACEIKVYDKKWGIAGTLDDIGLLPRKVYNDDGSYKLEHDLVLCDLKSSNQYKDFYWVQVAAYYAMFKKQFKIYPKKFFILKTDKNKRDYSIEWITDMKTAVGTVKTLVDLGNQLETIKQARKPEVLKI